ncbi:MAG TPA: LapA family protein [Syntrophomonadaceae bacterium]|nr:LapA family protein [Syntrophomonadaceae bacterium]
MYGYLIGAVFFLLSIAIFVYQNTSQVIIHFITWTSSEISLALVVLLSVCVGALITFFVNTSRQIKFARRIKELTNQNKKLQKKINKFEGASSDKRNILDIAAIRDE